LTAVAAADLQLQLVNILKAAFPDWTDTQASNNMILLLETLAAVQEMDYAYINRMAREAFIQYALDYRNVTAHAKALGYTPSYQTPSIVTAVINSISAVTATTTVPAGTQFKSNLNNVVYQTITDVQIPNGHKQSNPVVMWQWVSYRDSYIGTGAAHQQLTLNQNTVIPTSVAVSVNGILWAAVDNFVDSISTDQVYTCTLDLLGNYTALFGDGVNGACVPAGANVSINYNTGGGSQNAIGPNGLTLCINDVHDAGNGTLLTLSAYNQFAAVPGGDAETTAQIKARAPLSVQSPRCLLTLSDIQNAVNAVPGVFTSIAADWNSIPALPRYLVEVFVVPVGFGTPSPDLITAVNTLLTLTKPMVMGQMPVVTAPTYVTINFNIQVFVKPGFNQNSVQNAVAALVTSLFNNTDATLYNGFVIGFGMSIYMSVITALIQQLPGVRNVTILSPGDTNLTTDQFPVLGSITFAAAS
jgi:uncharacterized phage protein gp47/JayE